MNNWDAIRQEIGRMTVPCGEQTAFWADFKARARLTVQEQPAPVAHRGLWGALAFAGSVALLALIALPFFLAQDSMAGAIEVTSLEVTAPCRGAIILNLLSENGKKAGTVVWVSGLEEPHDDSP